MQPMTCLERNLGTDFALSCWLYLVSAVIYSVALLVAFSTGDLSYFGYYSVTFLTLFLASLLWDVGCVLFVYVSYPGVTEGILKQVMSEEIDNWSFVQKYFTGNTLLVATWLIVIGFLPYYEGPIYAYLDGEISQNELVVMVTFLVIGTIILFIWLYNTLPAVMRANGEHGSSYIFDAFCCIDICGDNRSFCKRHIGNDFQAAAWIVVIGTFASVPVSAIAIVANPNTMTILFLLCSVIFFLGSVPLVSASYNIRSNHVLRMLHLTSQPSPLVTPLAPEPETHVVQQEDEAKL
jgi:hypothetical protein